MADGEEHSRGAELRFWAERVRVRSTALAARAGRAAESAAASSAAADRMIERLTERNPQHAERLHGVLSTAAGQRAAIAGRKDRFHVPRRGGSEVLPARPQEPGTAAFSALDSYLRDMAATCVTWLPSRTGSSWSGSHWLALRGS
jgi:hypothetical protein